MSQGQKNSDHDAQDRVQTILQAVARRRIAGERVTDQETISEHAELAEALISGLNKLHLIEIAGRNAKLLGAANERRAASDKTTRSTALRIRCPHCLNPYQIASDDALDEIVCSTCSGKFLIVDPAEDAVAASACKKVAHFELIEHLGAGSFGTVWKAYDSELDRTVAIKLPRPSMYHTADSEKFLREARAVAQLTHPNIVSVHEVGREGDQLFIVSDFVCGLSLDEWLCLRQPSMREVAEICATIAQALHHAHERGVIHRDLKPANIVVDCEGAPHLTDFGLARRDAGEITMTTEGQVLGTPAYMSPEQALGKAHAADHRTDVYSLGVILYELTTSDLPFRGSARMLMQQVIQDDPPSPRKLNANVPRDLETITLKCMEKDPAKRYATAKKVSEELNRWLTGKPLDARPASRGQRLLRVMNRHRIASLSIALAVASLLVGTLVSLGYARKSQDKAREASRSAEEARRLNYFSNMVSVPHLLNTNRYDLARDLLNECADSLRSWEWRYWNSVAHSEYRVLANKAPILDVAFSPNSRFIACAGDDGLVTLHSVSGDNAQAFEIPPIGRRATSLEFHPKGALLFVGYQLSKKDEPAAVVWNLATRQPQLKLFSQHGSVKSVAIQSQGARLLTGHYDGAISVWDTESGSEIHTLFGGSAPIRSMALSADGNLFATAAADWVGADELRLHSWPDGGHSSSIDIQGICEALSLHSKKPWLFAGLREGSIALLSNLNNDANEVAKTAVRRWPESSPQGSQLSKWSLDLSPDCNWLACGSRNSAIELIRVPNSVNEWSKSESYWLKGHGAFVNAVAFSPNGRYLASGSHDGTVRIWDLAAARRPRYLNTEKDNIGEWPYCRSVFAESCKRIWSSSTQSALLRCFDPSTGEIVAEAGPFPSSIWMFTARSPELFAVPTDKGVAIYKQRTSLVSILNGTEGLDISSLDLGPKNSWVAYSVGTTVYVRSLDRGRLICTLEHSANVKRIVCSEDGTLLGTALNDRDNTVYLWRLSDTSAPIVIKRYSSTVYSIAISKDNESWVIASGASPVIEDLVDTTGLGIALSGHGGTVTNAIFCEDDSRVATTTLEGVLHLWDAQTGREVYSQNLAQHLYALDMSKDGTLVVGGRDEFHGPVAIALSTFNAE